MSSRGIPFQPGNTFGRGRPKGSQNKSSSALQQLLNENADMVIFKCKAMALQGDRVAMRLCMERVLPLCKEQPVKFRLGPVKTAAEVIAAVSEVVQRVAAGKLAPADGQKFLEFLAAARQIIDGTQVAEIRQAVVPDFVVALDKEAA